MSDDQYVSPEFDRPRRKDSEYDPECVVMPKTASDELREIYATDPDDPGPGRVNAQHRW